MGWSVRGFAKKSVDLLVVDSREVGEEAEEGLATSMPKRRV